MQDEKEGNELLTCHSDCSSGATGVHHPLCLSSPQCLTQPSHKPPLKTSCSPFYGSQMVGRPLCLWTCLSSLVKLVDLSNIKTAIYEKVWNKTHKHPATETIKRHLISQRALLQDESWTAESPIYMYPSSGVVLRSRWRDYTQVRYFFFLCVKGFYLRALGVSAGLWQLQNFSLRNGEAKQTEPSAFRSKLNRRTTVWPAVHNILFQHWLHLKQILSRPVHLSQRGRGISEKV